MYKTAYHRKNGLPYLFLWTATGKNLPVSESCRHDLTMTTTATSDRDDIAFTNCRRSRLAGDSQ